jgi:hypothetical protein
VTPAERELLIEVASAIRHLMAVHPLGGMSGWRKGVYEKMNRVLEERKPIDAKQS